MMSDEIKINRAIFKVKRNHIDYIRNTLESYDGMALVRTIDPFEALIEIHIASGCDNLLEELINSLKYREGIEFIRYAE